MWGGSGEQAHLVDVVAREGGVGGHEEVAARGGDERGDDADEVVVHVAWITEGLGACGHDRRHLG